MEGSRVDTKLLVSDVSASPVLVIPDALPLNIAKQAQEAMLTIPWGRCDWYDNPFERKIGIPKQYHGDVWAREVIEWIKIFTPRPFGQIASRFDPCDDYFTGFFIYRHGDYLRRHLDSVIHDDWRKAVVVLLYLSDLSEDDGGELELFGLKIQPQFNTMVMFLNTDDAYHEALPLKGPWYHQRLLYTTALVVPSSVSVNGQHRDNTRALFVPRPDEQWTPELQKLALERSM